MKTYYLYKHTFPNNKVYIGITCQKPTRRWRANGQGYLQKDSKTGKYIQPAMANAIKKYLWLNVKHEILFETNSKQEVEEKERYYITKVYHSNDEKFGYNIANGGSYLGVFSTKTRHIMSLKKRGKAPWNKGKHFSEEAKRNMSLAHIGHKPTKETIEKRKKIMQGFKHSEESKRKMSLKAMGNQNSKGCKRSQEYIEKLRQRKLGTHLTVESKDKISKTKRGCHWWNNGKIQCVAKICPGKEWVKGRLH